MSASFFGLPFLASAKIEEKNILTNNLIWKGCCWLACTHTGYSLSLVPVTVFLPRKVSKSLPLSRLCQYCLLTLCWKYASESDERPDRFWCSICLLIDPIVNQLQVASIHLLADLASHLLAAIFLMNRQWKPKNLWPIVKIWDVLQYFIAAGGGGGRVGTTLQKKMHEKFKPAPKKRA